MDELESNKKKGNADTTENNNSKDSFFIPTGENKKIINTDNRKTNNKQNNWPNKVQAITAIILIIITAIYTYYAREQVIETRKAVKVAEDSVSAGEKSINNSLAEEEKL